MKELFLIIFMMFFCISCAHCSLTKTHFTGKTTGVNPYGSGNIVVDRESYWGDLNCILKMMDNSTK